MGDVEKARERERERKKAHEGRQFLRIVRDSDVRVCGEFPLSLRDYLAEA